MKYFLNYDDEKRVPEGKLDFVIISILSVPGKSKYMHMYM